MNHIYPDCTLCNTPLTEEEIERNDSEGNPAFTICNSCLKKGKDKFFEIAERAYKNKEE